MHGRPEAAVGVAEPFRVIDPHGRSSVGAYGP